MTRLLRYLPLVILIITMGLIESSQTSPASAQPGTPQAGSDDPVYTPPKRALPRARVGGGLRGTDDSYPEVEVLAPDHVGFTVKQTPVLNWYLSKPTAYTVKFTLVDNRTVKPLHEAPLPPPKEAGVQSINLKDLNLTLEPDVQYRWYVSVILNQDSPSQDIVAGGVIERCEFNECVTVRDPILTCNIQGVTQNARVGLWYDAMGCLCDLIKTNPTDSQLRMKRAALLKQVGLNALAEWDLKSIQPAAK